MNVDKERFLSRDQQLCKFMRTEEIVYITMAAVSLFWNTNMAALTSCENALSRQIMAN